MVQVKSFPRNISVYGKMRSGKDTVADLLRGYRLYKNIAYGDELKRLYHEIFGYSGDTKDRDGYQWFGQAMRARKPDVWVELLERQIKLIESRPNDGIVITDMRQPNEYEHLSERGFLMIKVHTPDEIRIERARARGEEVTEEQLKHETEQYIDDYEYDYVIVNDGTLGDLHRQLRVIMQKELIK
jgi:dephospho-CoA kinase